LLNKVASIQKEVEIAIDECQKEVEIAIDECQQTCLLTVALEQFQGGRKPSADAARG
jgi:hypothetical protein